MRPSLHRQLRTTRIPETGVCVYERIVRLANEDPDLELPMGLKLDQFDHPDRLPLEIELGAAFQVPSLLGA